MEKEKYIKLLESLAPVQNELLEVIESEKYDIQDKSIPTVSMYWHTHHLTKAIANIINR